MPVSFRMARLNVTGFRGIRQLDLDLPDGAVTCLIGANNAGKSSLVTAMALALRGGGMHKFTPEVFDFFHDAKGQPVKEFSVDLVFDAPSADTLPMVQCVGKPQAVHGIRARGKTEKGGRHEHRHVLIGADGKAITVSPNTALSAADKEKFKDHGIGWRAVYARPDDIRDLLPEVWLLRADNLYASLNIWKTGPLQRLSSMLSQRFLRDEWEFTYHDQACPMPAKVKAAHAFLREAVSAFPFWKDDLRPRLEEALSRFVGRSARMSLAPDVQSIEEWLAQQLATSFSADAGGWPTPLQRMGDGWQSLVRLAALDVLRQYPEQTRERVVLLLEEPETFLHPHLRRKLRDVLADLASKGWVILLSTHAPEFISFAGTQQIVRLWRDGDVVTARSLSTASVPEAPKFQERLDERGNHEMLFANRVVLCEGKDDYFALRLFLDRAGTDLDGRSVTVLGVGGVETMPAYARLAKQLGIPWCALTDEDLDPISGSVKPKTAGVRAELATLAGAADRIAVWPGSLEACVGLSTAKAKPEWQQANLAPKDLAELKADYPGFASACDGIRAWLG